MAPNRVRFGYRRSIAILKRGLSRLNPKRAYRLYTEDGLTVRCADPCTQATGAALAGSDARDDTTEYQVEERGLHERETP